MKLYHGTNGAWLENILRVGLEPRRRIKSRSNWTHSVPSNPNAVYFTDSYAPYFAFASTRGKDPSCAVIEVETDLLDESLLCYDEDCWEQLGRASNKGQTGPRDGIPGDMKARTLEYRRRQKHWQSQYDFTAEDGACGWVVSLRALGTCCYLGTVPPEAITRAIRWPHRAPNIGVMLAWDPSINLMNQQIMGLYYKTITAKLFGDPPPDAGSGPYMMINRASAFPVEKLEGVERFDLQRAPARAEEVE